MAWREQMQKGSFRGVPFRAKSQDTEGGRRVAVHEYPGRDEPWAEDLGRKARTHNIEMHVIGSDYMERRDALIDALEKAGPAELVHPWRGRMQVQVQTYNQRESSREGGMAIFTVSYVEAGRQQFPTATADTASAVDAAADNAIAASVADFAKVFSVDGKPGWVADEAVAVMDQAADAINAATAIPAIPSAVTDFYGGLTGLQGSLNALVRKPADLGNGLVGIIGGIGRVFSDPVPALKLLTSFGASMNTPAATTPARTAQVANQNASIALTKRAALIEETRLSATAAPESSTAAIAMRNDLSERLDAEAENASDTVYLALLDLRVAMVRDLTDRAAQLPNIGSFTPKATLPAVVLAHRLYGDASKADELVARNHIRHPGFVPGGTPLEVLNV